MGRLKHSADDPFAGPSARAAVPVIVEALRPSSVVDIGCGIGVWLAAFRDAGVVDLLGVDLEAVRPHLVIDDRHFRAVDLRAPLDLGRKFDLAVSLEVAEHLPPSSAEQFIANLTRAADVVLFSAALPFQGGHGHLNEQWPTYWQALFAGHSYQLVDWFRPRFWSDEEIGVQYRQNAYVYVRSDSAPATLLSSEPRAWPLDAVHPGLYLLAVRRLGLRQRLGSLRGVLPHLASSATKAARRR